MKFPASRRKVERAMEHIRDLNNLLKAFSESSFYSVSVKEHRGHNCIALEIDKSRFDMTRCALIIGDALHNLKSALDILYYQIFDTAAPGSADHRTRFPIRGGREELINAIDGGLKKKDLTENNRVALIVDLLLDVVQPYKAGNLPLWSLHELNILDKHQLLIPMFDVMRFTDLCFEDEKGNSFVYDKAIFTEDSCFHIKLGRDGKFTTRDKGHAALAIVFNVGVPYQSQSVIQSLHEIAETVTRTIIAFEMLPIRSISQT
jgi:hypothetical protein